MDKRCYVCGETKDIGSFSGVSRKSSECKPCAAALQKKIREKRKKKFSGGLTDVPSEKLCPSCNISVDSSMFYRVPVNVDGLSAYCMKCTREKQRRYNIRQYGLSDEDFLLLLDACGGGCWICGEQTSASRGGRLYVDHDHDTGEVRGLLCNLCNSGLGMFGDNVQNMTRAIEYLNTVPARGVLSGRSK